MKYYVETPKKENKMVTLELFWLNQSGVMELIPPKHQGSLPNNMRHQGRPLDWIITKVYDSVPLIAVWEYWSADFKTKLVGFETRQHRKKDFEINQHRKKQSFATCNLY